MFSHMTNHTYDLFRFSTPYLYNNHNSGVHLSVADSQSGREKRENPREAFFSGNLLPLFCLFIFPCKVRVKTNSRA